MFNITSFTAKVFASVLAGAVVLSASGAQAWERHHHHYEQQQSSGDDTGAIVAGAAIFGLLALGAALSSSDDSSSSSYSSHHYNNDYGNSYRSGDYDHPWRHHNNYDRGYD